MPVKIEPINYDEIRKALKSWEAANKKVPEDYDVEFVLTNTQSRIDALRKRGNVVVLADSSQTAALVQAARELQLKEKTAQAQRRASEAEDKARAEEQARKAEEAARKAAEKAAAKSKAAAFMKKISVDKP